jgi:hypothetical protein
VEKLPVTAAAALANYVPPWLTDRQIREHRDVPMFYAVGMEDINHERMRDGLKRLRAAGARVDLDRPRIGHVLNAEVAQAALDWFFDRCSEKVEARLKQIAADGAIADLPVAERVVEQRRWHEAGHVQEARRIVEQIEAPGRRRLAAAKEMVAAGKPIEAVEVLEQIENSFGDCGLAREARSVRMGIESDPAVRKELADRQSKRRADEAVAMYASAQRLVVEGKFNDAAEQCRRVTSLYGDTPIAERARTLLKLLEKRTNP